MPGNCASAGDFDLIEIVWAVNFETKDVVLINGCSGDDNGDVNDYNDHNNADPSNITIDYQ